MAEKPPASGDALPRADIRALYVQAVRVGKQHEAEAIKLQGQVLAAAEQIVDLHAKMKRQAEEHQAALTDRDLGHSAHVERLEADIARLHQAIREQGKQSLENEALGHRHARDARKELDKHVRGEVSKDQPLKAVEAR